MIDKKIKQVAEQVAKSVLFELDEKVKLEMSEFFDEHLKALASLILIDTKGVLPMTRIDNSPETFMREDEVGESLLKEKLLKNASQTQAGFIVVPKKEGQDD